MSVSEGHNEADDRISKPSSSTPLTNDEEQGVWSPEDEEQVLPENNIPVVFLSLLLTMFLVSMMSLTRSHAFSDMVLVFRPLSTRQCEHVGVCCLFTPLMRLIIALLQRFLP